MDRNINNWLCAMYLREIEEAKKSILAEEEWVREHETDDRIPLYQENIELIRQYIELLRSYVDAIED